MVASLIYVTAKRQHHLRTQYSIFPVWHTEWAFQRQTWEENVCSCTMRQRPQRALFPRESQAAVAGRTMKIMTQMADKDRPCTPVLPFTLPTPSSVFNFTSLCRKVEEFQQLRHGEGAGNWSGTDEDWGGEAAWGADRLKKAIYRPRSVRGVGLKQEAAPQTVGECIIQAGILHYWEL